MSCHIYFIAIMYVNSVQVNVISHIYHRLSTTGYSHPGFHLKTAT